MGRKLFCLGFVDRRFGKTRSDSHTNNRLAATALDDDDEAGGLCREVIGGHLVVGKRERNGLGPGSKLRAFLHSTSSYSDQKKSKHVLLRTTGLPYGQLPASSFIIVLSLFDDLSPADYYI
jgi:hypothetical protein